MTVIRGPREDITLKEILAKDQLTMQREWACHKQKDSYNCGTVFECITCLFNVSNHKEFVIQLASKRLGIKDERNR